MGGAKRRSVFDNDRNTDVAKGTVDDVSIMVMPKDLGTHSSTVPYASGGGGACGTRGSGARWSKEGYESLNTI